MEPENENNNNSADNFKLKGPRGWAHKLKNGVKGVLKNVTGEAKNLKNNKFITIFVLKSLKFIVPLLLIFAAAWYVISSNLHITLVASAESFISSSSTISGEAKKSFATNGSLIYLTNAEIKEMSSAYLMSLQKTNSILYEEMAADKRVGDKLIKNIAYADGFEISNAYEFILNAERMNFNRISWKEYDRKKGTISDLGTTKDKDTNLKYPKNKDDESKDLNYFIDLLTPYLQSYIVPSSMLSGIATKAETANVSNFVFQIIDKGYHDIEVLQYTLQTASREQTKKHYITENVTITLYEREYDCSETDAEGNTVEKTCKDLAYSASELDSAKKEAKASYEAASAEQTETVEVAKNYDSEVDKQYVYPVTKADTLKEFMRTEYELKKYNDDDVKNYTNQDMKYVTNREEFLNVDGLGTLNAKSGSGWTENRDIILTITVGENITSKYVWNDKLEEKYNETRAYEVDDVSEFVNKIDKVAEVEEKELTEEEQQSGVRVDSRLKATEIFSGFEVDYYRELEESSDITRIDLINAVPSIYKDYLYEDGNYSKYIGFNRSYLSMSYSLLNKHLKEKAENESSTNWAGLSIGSISGLDMIWPLDYKGNITSVFGEWRPEIQQYYGHSGLDITPSGNYVYPNKSAYSGSYVYAASSGTVVDIFKETPRDQGNASSKCPDTAQGADYTCGGVSSYGRHVKIKDDNGYTIVYGHLYEIADNIEKGSKIKQGQVLGVMGTTGSSTGVHLHFEVRQPPGAYANAINPLEITSITTSRNLLKK